MAAGEGKRLRPLTLETPKPLLKIKGRPILDYTFSSLPEKISEVILVVGYKGEQIKNYLGGEFSGKKIKYVFQGRPGGTFHALASAKNLLAPDPFLVLVADDLYKKEDLEELARHPAGVLVFETATPERFGICKIGESGFLEEITEKPDYFCGNLANTGACVLDHAVFEEPIIYGANGEELLAPMIGSLAKSQKIKVIQGSFWFPIGYPEDLEKAEEFI